MCTYCIIHRHIQFWLNDENLEPFPYMDGKMNFKEVLHELHADIPSPTKSKLVKISTVSKEESAVHGMASKTNIGGLHILI
jgi:hypothetical protein